MALIFLALAIVGSVCLALNRKTSPPSPHQYLVVDDHVRRRAGHDVWLSGHGWRSAGIARVSVADWNWFSRHFRVHRLDLFSFGSICLAAVAIELSGDRVSTRLPE